MLIRAGTWFFCLLCLASCAIQKPKEEEDKKSKGPQLVGHVASIPRSRAFVLIQSYGPWTVPPASVLTSRGEDGRAANLRFTGETLGQFAAADIQSGQVEKGDTVYSHHVPKPPLTQAAPITFPDPSASIPENPPAETEPPTFPTEPDLPLPP